MAIDETAIIEKGAIIGENCHIGPLCVIGAKVTLGDNCHLHSHVVVTGKTTIGHDCEIFPFASIGHIPQDLKYEGEESMVEIGDHCKIREYVTVNGGTKSGGMVTKIGDYCLLMTAAHVAHDCILGNHVIMVNNATLAGHVTIGDHAILGGLSAVHQFVNIGKHAIIGGLVGVLHDVIPYASITADRGQMNGLNIIGMNRFNISRSEQHQLRDLYKKLFEDNDATTPLSARAKALRDEYSDNDKALSIIDFVLATRKRGLMMPKD